MGPCQCGQAETVMSLLDLYDVRHPPQDDSPAHAIRFVWRPFR